jgi:hypothetical protein
MEYNKEYMYNELDDNGEFAEDNDDNEADKKEDSMETSP